MISQKYQHKSNQVLKLQAGHELEVMEVSRNYWGEGVDFLIDLGAHLPEFILHEERTRDHGPRVLSGVKAS